jgi:hypothetical protein
MVKVRVLTVISFLICCSCHHDDPNPHLKDPIYLEIVKEKEQVSTQINSLKTEVEKNRREYETAPLRTGQRQDAADDYFDSQHRLDKQIEKFRYLSISAEKRITEDRKSYRASVDKGVLWPDPDEFKDFALEKKLLNAPREWNPLDRISQRKPAAVKPPDSEEHSEKSE